MKFRIAFFLQITVVFCCSAQLLSEEQTQEQSNILTVVTPENTAEPITFIAIVKNHPFSIYHPNGTPTGLLVEFWELWSKVNGIPIKIEMKTVLESIAAIKTKGQVHTGLFNVPSRKKWADFSQAIHNIKSGVWGIKNTAKELKLSDMSGKKIAVLKGSFHQKYLEENYPEIIVVPYNYGQSLNQLLSDEIQAVFSENPSTSSLIARLGYTGLIALTEEEVFSHNVYATLAKGQSELLELINRGIDNIPVNKIIALEKKWLPTEKPFFKSLTLLDTLTILEKKWLQQNSSFTLGIEPNARPLGFINEQGKYSGIPAEYIEHINNILGFRIC